eukprot:CAMPEP_0176384204 /NCGR_PEP_ID=MMETSP0126-20121128/34130_1 /TAXON_ID=141414 ORGANISM="Strombidinopsis acuminatum, Strain SPMC142" /NCGR_SAMPLE_ID=MMETSP0126 /ASSEMBLY_ACC=CAM_ASM_000229 /LENGTH=74 /DNA_ID=CAMNT_0017749759 /DNA_START=1292 /DNA_END=1516 /DNA_ORIENTATION=-
MTWLRWGLFLDRFSEFNEVNKEIGFEDPYVSRKKLRGYIKTKQTYLKRCDPYVIVDEDDYVINQIDEEVMNSIA